MKRWALPVLLVVLVVGVALPLLLRSPALAADPAPAAASAANPARAAHTVTAVQAQRSELPIRLAAGGSVVAWQEASIGTEADGLRLTEVKVEVGEIWCGHGANVGRTIKTANYMYGDFYRVTQLFLFTFRDILRQPVFVHCIRSDAKNWRCSANKKMDIRCMSDAVDFTHFTNLQV